MGRDGDKRGEKCFPSKPNVHIDCSCGCLLALVCSAEKLCSFPPLVSYLLQDKGAGLLRVTCTESAASPIKSSIDRQAIRTKLACYVSSTAQIQRPSECMQSMREHSQKGRRSKRLRRWGHPHRVKKSNDGEGRGQGERRMRQKRDTKKKERERKRERKRKRE